jgi:hypothetical protein
MADWAKCESTLDVGEVGEVAWECEGGTYGRSKREAPTGETLRSRGAIVLGTQWDVESVYLVPYGIGGAAAVSRSRLRPRVQSVAASRRPRAIGGAERGAA